MAILVPQSAARLLEREGRDGTRQVSMNYIGSAGRHERGPQAVLNERTGRYVIEPHFHEVDQFQIFVRGNATLGRQPVCPVTVHYTDAYTPYGPIVCDEGGMAFYNLRPRADIGAHWMPGSEAELHRRAGRHRTVTFGVGGGGAASGCERQDVIPMQPDGLRAVNTVAAPGWESEPEVAAGGGRYELVLFGSVEARGEALPAGSLMFTHAGERVPGWRAGAEGAQVLTMQAPRP